MEAIRPRLSDSEMPTLGRVVIGTVSGDIHDIGKNLVAMFLRGAMRLTSILNHLKNQKPSF